MARYQDVLAWKECHALALHIYPATRPFPKTELYGLTSQLRRAASSAPTNIVEGPPPFSVLDLFDLRRHHKIILVQSSDRVRPQFQLDLVPSGYEIGRASC